MATCNACKGACLGEGSEKEKVFQNPREGSGIRRKKRRLKNSGPETLADNRKVGKGEETCLGEAAGERRGNFRAG